MNVIAMKKEVPITAGSVEDDTGDTGPLGDVNLIGLLAGRVKTQELQRSFLHLVDSPKFIFPFRQSNVVVAEYSRSV